MNYLTTWQSVFNTESNSGHKAWFLPVINLLDTLIYV